MLTLKLTRMMKQFILTAVVAVYAITITAQDAEVKRLKDESNKSVKKEPKQKEGWTKGGVFNLNLSQGASRNWAAGRESRLSPAGAVVVWTYAQAGSRRVHPPHPGPARRAHASRKARQS